MSDVKEVNGRLEGTATFGHTDLNFIKLDDVTTKRLLQKFYDEKRCEGIADGELSDLK